MGRKSKRKANPGPDEVSKADRKELIKLCGQVIDLAATPSPPTPKDQWDEFVQIHNLIEKIRKKQNGSEEQPPCSERDAYFPEFLEWLNGNGVSTDSVKITKFDEGYGLEATTDIKMNEKLMDIPRKVMISDQNALDSPLLGDLIRGDRLLKGMPNVSLAVFILSEKLKPDSFWQPYLNMLPSSYGIPLYFTPAEIQLLQGSTMYSDAMKQHKNVARQYAYLFKLLNLADHSKLQLRENFTYDLYRWAVGTVMTRQNQVPSKDGEGMSLGLIPLWDMCNHTNGEMKTDFDKEHDACVNYALRDFAVGDQIYMCYGRRSSADLLLYSGFVYPANIYDGMAIQLGLSSSDRLYAMKAQLCAVMKLGVPSQNYHISGGEEPVSLELLTFLRVFCMSDVELRDRLMGEDRAQALFNLVDRNQLVSKLNELRTCVYIATRITLLQRQYKTSIEEDEEKLKDESLSHNERAATRLILMEKRTLDNALEYCALWREKIEALPEGATTFKLGSKEDEDVAETWEDRDEEDGQKEGAESGDVGVVRENGDLADEAEKKEKSEECKVNDDAVQENGNGKDPMRANGDGGINGDISAPANGQIQSSSSESDSVKVALKSTPNGNLNNNGNGLVISNGNGAVNGDDEQTLEAGCKRVNGAMQGDSVKPNGHLVIASSSGSIEE